ncbi:MAG TPA: PIN domain-containing protein [Thermoanaerobaculia bacterium]|nr:PIN domain-containing protein [Thermoanaerobaculia bacterium]
MRYLLDTNICIYALKHRPPEVLEHLRAVGPTEVALSVLTVLELRQGAEGSQQPQTAHSRLDLFLGPLRVLPFETEDALVGARVRAALARRGRPIGDLDSLIASQAIARDLILVTNNLGEFERVEGLRTANWVGQTSR